MGELLNILLHKHSTPPTPPPPHLLVSTGTIYIPLLASDNPHKLYPNIKDELSFYRRHDSPPPPNLTCSFGVSRASPTKPLPYLSTPTLETLIHVLTAANPSTPNIPPPP